MLEYQRIILADSLRNGAFIEALQHTVKPGMVVADIGSGTGFLSFIALMIGAKECYLYEQNEQAIALSKQLAKENGFLDRCHFVHRHSLDVRKPVPADLVVAEVLGNFAYEEGIIETMADAKRFLKPGGIRIPQTIRQFVAPITSEKLWRSINTWSSVHPGLTFNSAQRIALQNAYVRTVHMGDLLAAGKSAVEWDRVDLTTKNDAKRRGAARWEINRAATVYGFAVWWECDLLPTITLSTTPAGAPTHWEQIVLPVLQPVDLAKGDALSVTIDADTRRSVRIHLRWEITVRRGEKMEKQVLDMRNGDL